MKTRLNQFNILSLLFFISLAVAPRAQAGTVIWNGASGTDTNWSNGNNWAGAAAPGGGDDVKFFNAGTNGAACDRINSKFLSSVRPAVRFMEAPIFFRRTGRNRPR
jgi:hypothetical protein